MLEPDPLISGVARLGLDKLSSEVGAIKLGFGLDKIDLEPKSSQARSELRSGLDKINLEPKSSARLPTINMA